jgi:integral membrane protein (TIGR01906 family)
VKYAAFITRLFCIIGVPLLLLSASIACAVNSPWVYESGFEKYGIAEKTGIDETELEKAAEGLITYFNSTDELIDLTVMKAGRPMTLFNEREVIHLKDVKGLFLLDYFVLGGTLVYILGYLAFHLTRQGKKAMPHLVRTALWGGGLTLALMAALGLGALTGFDELFLRFHLISFANDFWLLDPSTDYLVMLFPQGFWYDVTMLVAVGTAVAAALLAGGSFFWLKRTGKGLHFRS